MKELNNEAAILNFIGKRTVLEFEHCIDGIVTYKTVIPKEILGEYCFIELEVFIETTTDFLKFETTENVLYKKQVFEVNVIRLSGNENLYHKKYVDPSNN